MPRQPDKVIVVSGVGPGMGQAMAKIAAAEGAKVVMGARNQEFLGEVAKEISAAGGEVIGLSTDVTDAEQCQALAKMAIYDVNCLGALRMSQAVLPGMKKAGAGAIINVSTQATVKPFPGEAAYAAAKGGLNVLTRHMATDYGQYNIRVNTVRMGWIGGKPVYGYIDAQVEAGGDRDEIIAGITKNIALDIIPPEDDCARAVLVFLSDYAKVISGTSLDVNGGEYMAP